MFGNLHCLLSLVNLVQKVSSCLHCGECQIRTFPAYTDCISFRSAKARSALLLTSISLAHSLSVAPLVASCTAARRAHRRPPPLPHRTPTATTSLPRLPPRRPHPRPYAARACRRAGLGPPARRRGATPWAPKGTPRAAAPAPPPPRRHSPLIGGWAGGSAAAELVAAQHASEGEVKDRAPSRRWF